MFALKFSFVLRYHKDIVRSIHVPLEKLAGINLADGDFAARIMSVIEEDDALLNDLFGDYAHSYRAMAEDRDIYWKDLMRFGEEIVIVPVKERSA
ncbi:hypothetical protein Achl_4361 (plasmid) [Pseudarthrobacter chlorophenolicus A6]|uniref:Uncharacterized protein n=1 Tax=Pseudarthrobacter chlorophenolicus (strain ATCC 700700 / DSM 12829 / CIP 107037 / JCM 12360 / KCTC 9906 / NCIMB 13794 / A6) TaxID=452863 RepID=B8HIR5_PSECP|nr:hypothetical protein [Pseudarthrobacter chlorophenolicus]ACL42312.1 hypothetical protein Achl_4361 [Pseudarthrobacter chlorophenolicus A6]SDQ16342.1 hypothetical protein SAMN04489738_0418 [Pseudarthrobacter chlorophenolicus]